MVTTTSTSFFIRSKRNLLSYFLRREERSKEASTPSKASPYIERMQLKNAGDRHFDFVEIAHAQLTESELSSVFAYPRFLRVLASRWFLDKPSDKVERQASKLERWYESQSLCPKG